MLVHAAADRSPNVDGECARCIWKGTIDVPAAVSGFDGRVVLITRKYSKTGCLKCSVGDLDLATFFGSFHS